VKVFVLYMQPRVGRDWRVYSVRLEAFMVQTFTRMFSGYQLH